MLTRSGRCENSRDSQGHAGSRRNDRDRDRSAAPVVRLFRSRRSGVRRTFGELARARWWWRGSSRAGRLVRRRAPTGSGWVARPRVLGGGGRHGVRRRPPRSRSCRFRLVGNAVIRGSVPSCVQSLHPPPKEARMSSAVTSRPCPSPIRPFPAVPRPCRSSPPTLCSERRSTAPCPRATRSPSSALAVSGAPNVSTGSSRACTRPQSATPAATPPTRSTKRCAPARPAITRSFGSCTTPPSSPTTTC